MIVLKAMVYGQNWVLFSDKPPLTNVSGRNVPKMDFNIVVANKLNDNIEYFIESARVATEKYLQGNSYHAWKFFEPCDI